MCPNTYSKPPLGTNVIREAYRVRAGSGVTTPCLAVIPSYVKRCAVPSQHTSVTQLVEKQIDTA